MLFFPVFTKLQPRPDAQAAPSRLVLVSVPFIETLWFQTLTHSFAQRRSRNPFLFNRFRTLSIATGVYPLATFLLPAFHSLSTTKSFGITSFADRHALSPVGSHRYKNHGGWGISRKDRATWQPNRKFHARVERRLRGVRHRWPASGSRREAAPPGNTARREDGG
jgi:hypothetical protein